MQTRQIDTAKCIKGAIIKYLLFFPIIVLLVTIGIITKTQPAIIFIYLGFESTYIHKKTSKETCIEHIFRFLAFFLAYKIVVMFTG